MRIKILIVSLACVRVANQQKIKSNGLFHFISIQGGGRTFPGGIPIYINFQGLLGNFSDISRGFLLKLFFSKGLDDQASSTYISFFQGVG